MERRTRIPSASPMGGAAAGRAAGDNCGGSLKCLPRGDFPRLPLPFRVPSGQRKERPLSTPSETLVGPSASYAGPNDLKAVRIGGSSRCTRPSISRPRLGDEMRGDDTPISLAFRNPVLRASGMTNDTYGEAKRFFELSDGQLHDAADPSWTSVEIFRYSRSAALSRTMRCRSSQKPSHRGNGRI